MKRSTKKGFTIVELVIVIAIIAILAAVLIPTFASLIQKANESNDIQAAKNMNTFLAAANVTGDVKSILDVYDVFEDSGFAVENYTPLYKDRYYYYDKEYNQILYVDDKLNVIYPTEHKGETSTGRTWMSLSMSAPKREAPNGYEAKETVEVTVKSAAEYAFVINEYNTVNSIKNLNLTIDGEIDMMGAKTIIEEAKGTITINGKNNAVIKNITSDYSEVSTDNAQKTPSQYNATALIGKTQYNVSITDVTFENLNVKNIYSTASFLVGTFNNNGDNGLTVTNVKIKDSTLVGHRWVGAVGSQICCNTATINGLTLTNTSVQTVGGRSAMILSAGSKCDVNITNFVNENSTFGIYDSKKSEQKFSDTNPTETPCDVKDEINGGKFITSIKNVKDDGTKEMHTYCYKEGALVFVYGKDSTNAKAYTAEDFKDGGLTLPKTGS